MNDLTKFSDPNVSKFLAAIEGQMDAYNPGLLM